MKATGPDIKQTLIHNFLGGMAWGLGLTLGVSLVAGVLSFVLSASGGIPLIGGWLAQLVQATLQAMKPIK